ncbi:unnamed protein product [Pleuronectes platessa]|uniref:Uncharacterized protein n=1 Tax=Pleuronectes platessa TaxID=8262 RepID=A0A9N7Z8F5_PLEPL|nr:unnamed protein product [Pleuronectes platessa]
MEITPHPLFGTPEIGQRLISSYQRKPQKAWETGGNRGEGGGGGTMAAVGGFSRGLNLRGPTPWHSPQHTSWRSASHATTLSPAGWTRRAKETGKDNFIGRSQPCIGVCVENDMSPDIPFQRWRTQIQQKKNEDKRGVACDPAELPTLCALIVRRWERGFAAGTPDH